MPAMPAHKSNCTLAVLQLAPLKSVSTQPAHRGNLHHIAVLQPAPLMCVLKLQRINRTTVVVACIPDFAEFIIDCRQGWTTAIVLCSIMII